MKNHLTNTLEKLAIALYTYIPPRRRKNYYLMYYSSNIGDLSKNYATPDGKFIFNNYKTFKYYGQQMYNIPNEIMAQINAMNYKDWDRLIPGIKQECDFSKFISGIFKRAVKKSMTIRLMRISYINFISRNSDITFKERENIAKAMGHTVEEQLLYKKNKNTDNTKGNENI